MSTSRGLRLTLSLLAILWVASIARAQEPREPSAVLRLVAQTAWTTPEEPFLRITLRISNNGDSTIAAPVVGWQLGSRVTSRVEYETALDQGPGSIASAETITLPGDLAPGASTEVAFRIDSSETGGIVQDDSGVYPLKLELRTAEGDQPIAAVTTAAIHIFQDPLRPVLFSWWTEVATPVAFGPDGTLIDPGFEAALGSHSGVVAQVEALAALSRASPAGAPIDVLVSPATLDQLRQAEDGFVRSDGTAVSADARAPEAAAETLARLREIASTPGYRLHAMPFAAPRLPALQSPSLRAHLEQQWRMGDQTFEQILDEQPDPTVARPPGLAFDQTSVDLLEARGVTTILGAADSVERPPQINDYAPPPAATLSTTSASTIELLLPDPGAQALLSDAELLMDPVRAAQVVLGELATIWKEEPVPPDDEANGLALDLPRDLPGAIWGPAIQRLSRAPFLEPVHAEDLPGELKPPPEPARLENPAPEVFTPAYANDLAETGRRVAAFGSILEEPAGEVDVLGRELLYAEASQYVGNEGSGQAWINSVNGVIDKAFSDLQPDTSRPLTFTSRSGTIPLRMGDPGDRVVNVKVVLASGRVEFLDDNERIVRLDQANQVITFPVEVKAAGPSNIDVFVVSPNGAAVLSQSRLVVRSTAVNPIALIITIGAGLVLIGLWSRRLFRRRHP